MTPQEKQAAEETVDYYSKKGFFHPGVKPQIMNLLSEKRSPLLGSDFEEAVNFVIGENRDWEI